MFGMRQRDKYVILHIPKTAGTSLHAVLQQLFKERNVSPLFGAYKLSIKEANILGKYQMICGHISWRDANEFYAERKIITFLREPLDRCVSWYYYAKSRDIDYVIPMGDIKYINSPKEAISLAKHLDIDDFFQQNHPHILQNISNRQAWQIGDHADIDNRIMSEETILNKALNNIEAIDFVGFAETFNQDVSKMAKDFNLGNIVEVPYANQSERRIGINDLSKLTVDKLMELNKLDLQLYEKAKI